MKQILMFVFGVPEELPPMMNEARSLASRGYRVRILGIRRTSGAPSLEQCDGIFIHRMYLYSRLLVGDSDTFEIVRYGEAVIRSFVWGAFHRAAMLVAHDLVTLPQAFPLSVLKRVPLVYRAHELWAEQKASFPRAGFWKWLDRFFVPRVDLVVAPEIHRARIYREEYGARRDPVVVFNCTRLLPLPSGPALRDRLGKLGISSTFIVYYQGGISSERMIDNLVQAMPLVPDDVVLVLVGRMEREFQSWYSEFVRLRGIERRVVHLGQFPYGEELFAICAGAQAGVMFVKGDCRNNIFNVTAANKMFEYMMMGLPILTVDFDAHREFVERKGIGRCVNAGDPASIGRVITELFQNRQATVAMGRQARLLAEQEFNWEIQSSLLLSAYEQLVENRGAAPLK